MTAVFLFILAVCLQVTAMAIAMAGGERHAKGDHYASAIGFWVSIFLSVCATMAAGLGGAL